MSYPLELDGVDARAVGAQALEFVAGFLNRLPDEPAANFADAEALVTDLLRTPPEKPGELDELLARLGDAATYGLNPASGRFLAYFPAGGLPSAAVGEMVALILNRYTGYGALAPGLVAMEHSVIRWLCTEFGLPAGSGGLVMTGGSMATLPAVVAARDDRLAGATSQGVIYVGEHAHHCIAKAAHIAGLGAGRIRTVASTSDLRMDVAAAAGHIDADRAAGLRPFMLVATAGATSTGLVDPLDELGALARREGLWFHVDGAAGAAYQLTDRGRARLAGIERADSLVLDPHKSLFLPYGTGLLLVHDEQTLRVPHAADREYLKDVGRDARLPDYASLGPELSREWRGLRLWLPLHLHGVAAFRDALDEKIDLARWVHRELAGIPELELAWVPDLTVVGFRHRDGNAASERLLERINGGGRIALSSTRIGGECVLRVCPQGLRTHAEQAAIAVDVIRSAARAC